jgi:hypothetical protein
LVLTVEESRKFKLLVKNKATGTSHGVFIYSPYWLLVIIVYEESNIIISVGLSALLVSTNRAMREPFYRGTSDSTGSTFFMSEYEIYNINRHFGSQWHLNTSNNGVIWCSFTNLLLGLNFDWYEKLEFLIVVCFINL